MAFRMDAALSPSLRARETVREATGSPVSMYDCTIECKISVLRRDNADGNNAPLAMCE